MATQFSVAGLLAFMFTVTPDASSAQQRATYPQLVATALQQGCIDQNWLAKTVQQELHPSGGSPRLTQFAAVPTAGAQDVLVQIRVDYQGGLGADRFVELAWSFGRQQGGDLTVVRDNGIAGVGASNVARLSSILAATRTSQLELCVTRLERDVATGGNPNASRAIASASAAMTEKVITDTATSFSSLAESGDLPKMRSMVEAPFAAFGMSGPDEKRNRECALEGGGLTAKTPKELDAVLVCVSGALPKLPLSEGWSVSKSSALAEDPAFAAFRSAIKRLPKGTMVAVTAEWGDCRHAYAVVMGSETGEAFVRAVFAGSNCPVE